MSFFRNKKQSTKAENRSHDPIPKLMGTDLQKNIEMLQQQFHDTPDLIVCNLRLAGDMSAAVVYLAGLADRTTVQNHVIRPLLEQPDSIDSVLYAPVSIGSKEFTGVWKDIEAAVLAGKSILLVDGENYAALLQTPGWPQREPSEPLVEPSLKGTHQGFVETGVQNIALIRRYINDKKLLVKSKTVGSTGKAKVSLLYLEHIVHRQELQILEKRLDALDIDGIINTGELEELIEDNSYSVFPQFLTTERPDTAASHLLKGRIAIVVDRSPTVLIAPVSFVSFFQSIDDYAMRWVIASFFRLLRLFAFFVSIFLPSFYIAVIAFHYEVIPLKLLISVSESRVKVPFPAILEATIMEITLEMLREAGLRLPAPIGQTVGIVGGIVIGQAVVEAGLVSNIMVIVVAFTAIASFIIPNSDMSNAIRLIRFPMMVLASLFGLVGIVVGFAMIIAHLISLESLGKPYSIPISPTRFSEWRDSVIRLPGQKIVSKKQQKQEQDEGT